MLIYHITIKVDRGIEEEWLDWMKATHVPDIVKTKQFVNANICRLLDQPDEKDATYIILYRCRNLEKLNFYIENFAPKMREEYSRKYGDRTSLIRTVYEVVSSSIAPKGEERQ